MRLPIIVLKFGSSVLRSEDDLPRAVHEIYRWYRQGHRVVVVVSAFAETTDKLLKKAESRAASPDAWATAALVSTGEDYSAALLALELDRAGIPAAVLDAHSIGLETCGPRLNADPVCLNTEVLLRHLQERPIAVVRSEEHTSELQSRQYLVCRLLLEKKKLLAQRPVFQVSQTAIPRVSVCIPLQL